MNPSENCTVDRRRFVEAMRGVAASVTVVTTDGLAGLHGATVSAFSSVSADPPTVLVCLLSGSRIADAVVGNRQFCVNVLPEFGQEIADRFAGRHDDRISDRFHGVQYSLGLGGPRIDGAAAFECEVQQVIGSGSHQIVLGSVRNVFTGAHAPLAYQGGQYQRLKSTEALSLQTLN